MSLPADECAELERLAKEKRVSVSWVVRDAVSQYLASKKPLVKKDFSEENQCR